MIMALCACACVCVWGGGGGGACWVRLGDAVLVCLGEPGLRCPAGEHESSRRLKTEILTQMEGVDTATAERRIVLVAATNRPEVPCTLACLSTFPHCFCSVASFCRLCIGISVNSATVCRCYD